MINSKIIYISNLITKTKVNCIFVLLFLEGYANANPLQIQGRWWRAHASLFLSTHLFYLCLGLSKSADIK